MTASTFILVSLAVARLRYPANPGVTFPLNQNTFSVSIVVDSAASLRPSPCRHDRPATPLKPTVRPTRVDRPTVRGVFWVLR